MTHPTQHELMEFLYADDALSADRRTEVASHAESCDACRRTLASWTAVRRELAAWDVPDAAQPVVDVSTTPARGGGSVLRWAAAAAVMLASGYGIARLTAPAPATIDVAAIRADVARDLRVELHDGLRTELRQELRAEIAADIDAKHTRFAADQERRQQSFQQAVAQAIDQLESQWATSFTSLRRDVETVAIRTQATFQQLASAGQSEPPSATP